MTADELADILPPDRSLVGAAFDHVRLVAGSDKKFMVHALGVNDDREAIRRALRVAEAEGWLAQFAEHCRERGLFEQDEASRTALQGIIHAHLGFDRPHDLSQAQLRYMRQVCLVEVDGHGSGSGFLVGPHVIMTSWHVVAPLLTVDGATPPGSGQNIAIHFDKLTAQAPSTEYRAHADDWLLASAPAHPGEAQGAAALPQAAAGDGLEGFLDYAVIRLAESPGYERGWIDLASGQVPRADLRPQLTLFQHPGANPLRSATGVFDGFRANSNDERLLYTSNSADGSSGGLVVNAEYEFIGLHQGMIDSDNPDDRRNTGILGAAIRRHIDTESGLSGGVSALSTPDPQQVYQYRRSNNAGPILGRTELQAIIWKCFAGDHHIGAISCDDGIKGKTFSSEILRACLPIAAHHVETVEGADFPEDAEGAARLILDAFHLPSNNLPAEDGAGTAAGAYVRDQLLPAVIDAFRGADPDTLRWLVIDNIDQDTLPDGSVRILFEKIAADIRQVPNFRLILLGWRGSVDGANPDDVAREDIQNPAVSDIERYLRLRYVSKDVPHNDGEIERIADLVRRSGEGGIRKLARYVGDKLDLVIDGWEGDE